MCNVQMVYMFQKKTNYFDIEIKLGFLTRINLVVVKVGIGKNYSYRLQIELRVVNAV